MSPTEHAKPGRTYVLFVLTAVYAVNIADRYVVSTLIEPIKHELALSDSAVGFLTGTALAIFYVTAGIPLGVLADRVNRRNMVAYSLAVWSVMTALCGLAQSYMQLLLARIGVGIGEAGGTPPSQSMIADHYRAELRPAAMSIFAVGAAIGATLGSAGGGWLSDMYGWRQALIVFGLVGMPIALIVRCTIAEPRRGQLDANLAPTTNSNFRDSLRFMWSQASLRHILIGATVLTYWGWGTVWWTPAFLVRSHGMSVGEAGALLGPMHGIGGVTVMLLTAAFMARFCRTDPRRQTWFVALTTMLATVPSIIAYSTTSTSTAGVMFWLFVPIIYVYIGPTSGLVQNLVLAGMRAQAFAVVLFLANIANLVIAPELIGVASDYLAARIDDPRQSLRYALIASSLTGFWAAYHYFAAAHYLKRDLQTVGSVVREVSA
jgi:MFS family permease